MGPNLTLLVGQEVETWSWSRKLSCVRLRLRIPCDPCHHSEESVSKRNHPGLLNPQSLWIITQCWIITKLLSDNLSFSFLYICSSYGATTVKIVRIFVVFPSHHQYSGPIIFSPVFLLDVSAIMFIIIISCYDRNMIASNLINSTDMVSA